MADKRRVSGGDYFRTGGSSSRDSTFLALSGAQRQGGVVPETIDAPRYLPAGGMTSETARDASGRAVPADVLVDRDDASEARVERSGGQLRWTPLEALEQAQAALPDAVFAERYAIAPALIHRISDAIEVGRAGKAGSDRDVLHALVEVRGVLPRAWPENPPLELFAGVDRAIKGGYRELLAQYNGRESVERLYDEDELFASAVNKLVPAFEYPNHAHQSVSEIREVVAKIEHENARRALQERGVPVAESGRYIGCIVESEAGFVVQDAGRGALVAHDVRKCEAAPRLGEQVDIGYAGGRAMVRAYDERGLAAAGQGVSVAR